MDLNCKTSMAPQKVQVCSQFLFYVRHSWKPSPTQKLMDMSHIFPQTTTCYIYIYRPAPSSRSPKWRAVRPVHRFQLVTCEVGAGIVICLNCHIGTPTAFVSGCLGFVFVTFHVSFWGMYFSSRSIGGKRMYRRAIVAAQMAMMLETGRRGMEGMEGMGVNVGIYSIHGVFGIGYFGLVPGPRDPHTFSEGNWTLKAYINSLQSPYLRRYDWIPREGWLTPKIFHVQVLGPRRRT